MGGNVFKDKTQSIKLENIEPTVKEYFEELTRIFPKKKPIFTKDKFRYVGSVGKKPESGDIDLAVDSSTIVDKTFSDESISEWGIDPKDVKSKFEQLKKRAKTATDGALMMKAMLFGIVEKINQSSDLLSADPKKITDGNIFGLFPQITPDGTSLPYGVQIDWMVGNLDWLEFSYHSTSYKGVVKGLHRTQLMLSMFLAKNHSFNHVKGVSNRDTGEVVASNPKEAIDLLNNLYGTEITRDQLSDYHELMKIVRTLPKEDFGAIIDAYFKVLDRTRADIPEDLQDEWRKRKSKLGLTGKFLPDTSALKESTKFRPGTFRAFLENQDKRK